MDKVLKPSKLDLDPNKPDAQSEWEHWHLTLTNYLAEFTGANAATPAQKLSMLTNFVSSTVYSYFSTAKSFEDAISALDGVYKKPKNETFCRYQLSSRCQQEGESVQQYFNALETLAKDCTFTDATKDVYRSEQIRDSFVRGLRNAEIRQRLLEEEGDCKTLFTRARTLELAVKNNQTMSVASVNAITIGENHPTAVSAAAYQPLP